MINTLNPVHGLHIALYLVVIGLLLAIVGVTYDETVKLTAGITSNQKTALMLRLLENNNIPIMFLLLDKYKTKLLNADVPTIDNWSITPLNSISGKIRNHYNIEKHGNGGIITTSIVRTYSKFGNNLYITTITDSIYKLETPFDKNINLNLYFKESKF